MEAKIKIKKKIIILFIMLFIMLFPVSSKAGLESKANGSAWGTTVSEAFRVSLNLRASTSTLGENSLKTHLTLNKDWGSVAYLALSGCGAVVSSTVPTTSGHTTTTGNLTGVMDFGKNTELTASLIKGVATNNYTESLTKNKDTNYVEEIEQNAGTDIENSKGMALAETNGWYNVTSTWSTSSPCIVRTKIYGFNSIGGGYYFRPIIWNK